LPRRCPAIYCRRTDHRHHIDSQVLRSRPGPGGSRRTAGPSLFAPCCCFRVRRRVMSQAPRRAPANICGPVHRLLGTKPIVAGLSRRRTPNVKTSTNGLSFSPCPPELRSFRLCDHVMSLWHKHCTFIGDWDCWSPVWYRAPPGRFISSPAAYLCGTSKAMQRLAEQGKGHTGRKLAASRYSVSRS
jgi:hypothetical protein